jgi:YHS domain-containing protein
MKRKNHIFNILFVCIAGWTCVFIQPAQAQSSDASKRADLNLEKGIAISGYDPVTYFTLGRAVHGSSSYSFVYNGATYHFSSEANLDTFKMNPGKYEPQCGGWCAYAMGKDGIRVKVDPATFKIIDNKLYLFYNSHFNNTLKKWNEDESSLLKASNENWNKLNTK